MKKNGRHVHLQGITLGTLNKQTNQIKKIKRKTGKKGGKMKRWTEIGRTQERKGKRKEQQYGQMKRDIHKIRSRWIKEGKL